MAATAVPVTRWQGCYSDGWQDLICPEAFAHPAKYARGLIHRIYRHLIEQGYVRAGETVLDPFGGVALGALDAMTYGLRYVGVELEPRFVALGQQNLALWRQRYGFTGGTLVQGDSRQLRQVLAGAQVGCVVGSPPYEGCINNDRSGEGIDWTRTKRDGDVSHQKHGNNGIVGALAYGITPGQLGAMPSGSIGAVVGSPPYEGTALSGGPTQNGQGYTQGARCFEDYGTSLAQLGNTSGETFWAASAQIMTELAVLLPPGAVCAWVVKAYIKDKQVVPFPDQWRQLCEAHGFTLCEEIHASLVEHHGTQEGLFGGPQTVTTEKKSFFRRLAEKKGSPRIDHETVLIVRKAGDDGGVCCVGSPPFHESLSSGETASEMKARWGNGQLGGDWGQSYGTTPGNLGNMPAGRR